MIENCAQGFLAESRDDEDADLDMSEMASVCNKLFRKESGGRINGLALGINGVRVRIPPYGSRHRHSSQLTLLQHMEFVRSRYCPLSCLFSRPDIFLTDYKRMRRRYMAWTQKSGGFK